MLSLLLATSPPLSYAAKPGDAGIHLEAAKVANYDFMLEKGKHERTPYYAVFSAIHGRRLIYIASDHLSVEESPNLLEHPTLKTISKIFSEFKPDVVIVEGGNTGSQLSPQVAVPPSKQCEHDGYRGCSESEFAINQALKAGAQFISGEPLDSEIREKLVTKGYLEQDLLGFYMVRKIPQYKREGNSAPLDEKLIGPRLEKYKKNMGASVQFGYREFLKWYAEKRDHEKKIEELGTDDSAPNGGAGATYFQKLSNIINLIRDQTVVARIENMMNRYQRVLVIYGSSHLLTEEPALIGSLGQPVYKKAF